MKIMHRENFMGFSSLVTLMNCRCGHVGIILPHRTRTRETPRVLLETGDPSTDLDLDPGLAGSDSAVMGLSQDHGVCHRNSPGDIRGCKEYSHMVSQLISLLQRYVTDNNKPCWKLCKTC